MATSKPVTVNGNVDHRAGSCHAPAMTIPVVWSPETRRHEPMREVWVGVPTEGTEVPAAGRPDPRGAARDHDPVEAAPHDDDVLQPRARPGVVDAPAHDPCRVEQRAVRRPGRPGPGRALRLPDPGDDPGHAPDPGRGDARPRGAVRLRHDDPGRPRHLGGGPGRGRLRADRGRPGQVRSVGASRPYGVRPLPTARPPRHPRRATAGPATSTTRRSRPRRCATPATRRVAVVDLDAHHGNGTQAIFWDRSDVRLRVDPRRPGGRLVPALLRPCRTRPAPARARVPRSTCRWPRAPATQPWLDAVRALADRAAGRDALVVSLGVDAAADDPESPLLVTADGYARGGTAARLARPPVGGRAGGRLPPVQPRRPGRGLPRRTRRAPDRFPHAARGGC